MWSTVQSHHTSCVNYCYQEVLVWWQPYLVHTFGMCKSCVLNLHLYPYTSPFFSLVVKDLWNGFGQTTRAVLKIVLRWQIVRTMPTARCLLFQTPSVMTQEPTSVFTKTTMQCRAFMFMCKVHVYWSITLATIFLDWEIKDSGCSPICPFLAVNPVELSKIYFSINIKRGK